MFLTSVIWLIFPVFFSFIAKFLKCDRIKLVIENIRAIHPEA